MNPGAAVATNADPKDERWKRAMDRVREYGQGAVAKLQGFAEQLA